MIHRYSFLILFVVVLGALSAWANRMEPRMESERPGEASAFVSAAQLRHRLELVETLDRLVTYQRYYRDVYGHHTQLLGRVGVSIPRTLLESYEIRVDEASAHRLRITAFSERDGRIQDRIGVDQDYRVTANFPLPAPRPEFLRAQALKHLRALQTGQAAQAGAGSRIGLIVGRGESESTGIYRGYFRFESKPVQTDGFVSSRQVVAIGIRPPVLDQVLDLSSPESAGIEGALAGIEGWDPGAGSARTGEHFPRGSGPASHGIPGQPPVPGIGALEEAYLAQKIFRGETGRYARDWAELAEVAAFRFEGREQLPDAEVPFGGGSSQPIEWNQAEALDITEEKEDGELVVEPLRHPARALESR